VRGIKVKTVDKKVKEGKQIIILDDDENGNIEE
jgi:hypothetical protein